MHPQTTPGNHSNHLTEATTGYHWHAQATNERNTCIHRQAQATTQPRQQITSVLPDHGDNGFDTYDDHYVDDHDSH